MLRPCYWLIVFLLIGCTVMAQVHLYVSTTGSDTGNGPFRTLPFALAKAYTYAGKDVVILLRAGTYYLDSTIVIQSGLRSLEIRAFGRERVVLAASKKIHPVWHSYRSGILEAALPLAQAPDRLFINGVDMPMARYPNFDSSARVYHGTARDAISEARVKGWQNPTGAYVHALHRAEWGDFHYLVRGKDSTGRLELEGGWQNNRPSSMNEQYRFVENVFEELDTPGEWYYDRAKQMLYLYPPQNAILRISISRLDEMIVLKGVKNVRISGLTFTQTNRTFMKTREPLLRTDWAIYRGGAILLDSTEHICIDHCTMYNLGGNAVFLSNYNLHDSVRDNHIFDIGASAIAFVGNPDAVRSPAVGYDNAVPFDKMDFTPGPKGTDYPRNCYAGENLIHDIGFIEKQSAGVEIDMASGITVSHNSIYNTPRAGINIGDGCWGGHLIEDNDVFNTVLETGDHGAFNSWARDRFWLPDRNKIDSVVASRPDLPFLDAMVPNVLRHNRFFCAHGWDIDLDDGSTNYIIADNVCLNGGLKLREGYRRIVRNNIIINNTFHLHVWQKNSGDVFAHNVVTNPYSPIGMTYWGKEIDSNYFLSPAALAAARSYSVDKHSTVGDPGLINPSDGDFGVTDRRLKSLAQRAPVVILRVKQPVHRSDTITWRGATLKNVETLGERSAAGLDSEEGVLVIAVQDGSPAAKSGLQKGDVLIRVGDRRIRSLKDIGRIGGSIVVMHNQREKNIFIHP